MLALFGGWIALSLSAYFAPPSTEGLLALPEENLRLEVKLRALSESFGAPRAPADLGDSIEKVRALRDRPPAADRLLLALQREAGREPDPEAVRRLESSDEELDRLFARVYGAERLTPAEAAELDSRLGRRDFLSDLAGVHAREKAGEKVDRASRFGEENVAVFAGALVLGTLIFLVGLGGWAAYLARRLAGRSRPFGFPARRLRRLDTDVAALRMSLFVLLFLLAAPGAAEALSAAGLAAEVASIGSTVFLFVVLLVILSVPLLGSPGGWRLVMGRTRPFGPLLGWGFAAVPLNVTVLAAALPVTLLLTRWLPPPSHPATDLLMGEPSLLQVVSVLFQGVIAAPVIEELSFRGLLFPALTRALNSPLWGGAISSFLFAAIHPQGVAAWPALFVVGAMCAFVTWQSGSLVPAMIFHALHNGILMGLTLVAFR